MFQIWLSKGEGMIAGPRFRVLDDAVRHVESNRRAASFAIRTPVGDWYQWPQATGIILPRREGAYTRAVGGELER